MGGSKSLDGFILLEELVPVLEKFIAEEGLLVASRQRNIVSEGWDLKNIETYTTIALYPPSPWVSPQLAMDRPGPSRSINISLPVPRESALGKFDMGARFDWWEDGRAHIDRDVIPRFDRLRRRILKVMCLGPWEAFNSKTLCSHVYRGTHYSQGALDWFNNGGEWTENGISLTRFRPHVR